MKTISHLILIVSLSSLVSCGAKKSGITLTVSNGMAISNNAYDGGLVFFGRSTDGKIFSAPVAYNTGAGNSIQIELDRGQWTFGAIGWNGGADEFVGTSECALVSTTLDSPDQTVNLDLTTTGCDDAAFGGNRTGGSFKNFSLITCGTLYDNTTTKTVVAADAPAFCTNSSVAPDFKIYAKSARVFVPVLIPGQAPNSTSPLTSECFTLTNGQITTAKKLPSKALPLAVVLFDDISCNANKLIAKYDLHQGMDFNYSGFDRLFFSPSSLSNLYLLATLSRRGQSPFMDSLPQFRCDPSTYAYPCIQLPTSTQDRFVQPGQEIYIKELAAGESCTLLSDTLGDVVVGSTSLAAGAFGCREENGKMFLRLQASDFATCSTTCTLSLKLTVSPTTTNISIKKSTAVPSLQAYDFIFRTLGHQDLISTPPTSTFLNAYNSLSTFTNSFNSYDKDRHFGILSQIREIFTPDLAGIFYNGATVNVSFWDDGVQRSYRLKSESVSSPIPAFITSNTNPGVLTTTRNFNRRITISRIVGGAFFDEQIVRFIDGEEVGMSEMYEYKDDTNNSETRIERELVYWNTQGTDFDRIERYNLETTKILNTSTIKHFRSSFFRSERDGVSAEGNARIEEYGFESNRNISMTYDGRAYKTLAVLKNDKALFQNSNSEVKGQFNYLAYYSDPLTQKFRTSPQFSNTSDMAKSPNGNHRISAWSQYNGANYELIIVKKSAGTVKESFTFNAGSSTAFIPRVTINNTGEAVVAFVKFDGTNYGLFALTRYYDAGLTSWVWKDTYGTENPSAFTVGTNDVFDATANYPFDLIDRDPSSYTAGSIKSLVYFDLVNNGIWETNGTLGTWSAANNFYTIGGAVLTKINVVKSSGDFYVTYLHAGNTLVTTVSTASFGSSTSRGTSSSLSFFGAYDIFAIPNGANVDVQVLTANGVRQWTGIGASTISSTGSALSNHSFNSVTPYCFARDFDGFPALALGAAAITDCLVPSTSYADPIKSQFKFDIESLKPSNFHVPSGNPANAPTGGIFTIPGY
jgi:hypothetical protein